MAEYRSVGLPVSLPLSGLLKYQKRLYFKMLPTMTPDRAGPFSTPVIYTLEQLPFRWIWTWGDKDRLNISQIEVNLNFEMLQDKSEDKPPEF